MGAAAAAAGLWASFLWFAIDEGVDPRLWPLGLIALVVGTEAIHRTSLARDHRMYYRNSGVKIIAESRGTRRERRWNTRRDIWVAIGSALGWAGHRHSARNVRL